MEWALFLSSIKKRFSLVLAGICPLLFWSVPSSAQEATVDEPHVACVQRQAEHLGIEIGTIDGISGPRTRQASKEIATRFPELTELRPFTRDNAIVWCREIGQLDEELAQYWQVKNGTRFEFVFSDLLNSGQQIDIQNAVVFAFRFFTNYEVELAGTIKIIASPDNNELAKQLVANSRYPLSLATANRIVIDQCRNQYLSGFNWPGIVALCFGDNFRWGRSFVPLRQLVTHEISHEIQRQFSGYVPNYIEGNELIKRMGPRWLIEGLAIAFEFKSLFPYVDVNEHIGLFTNEQTGYSGDLLRSMDDITSTYSNRFYDYAAMAGFMLADRKDGHRGYLTYWTYLARMDWEEAFTKAFGLTPEEFYDEFDNISQSKAK